MNPKGIPYLYVATTKETAVAEVRPHVGAHVSVGVFRTARAVELIDFSVGHDSKQDFFFEEPPPKVREEHIWACVDREFSEPASVEPDLAEYVPTQIIAEYFKSKGLDGVVYKSRLGDGFNIALFNVAAADLTSCSLVKVSGVSYVFGALENTYHVHAPPAA
ncbi:MAG: RES family NAD+ phosphorylase [Rubrivivax sp.]|nr:RES family NAD+ phosphorylase [Rubrivivax sp.]